LRKLGTWSAVLERSRRLERAGRRARKVQLETSGATSCTLTMLTMGNVQLDVADDTRRTFGGERSLDPGCR
jgi:hypothetical protein